MWRASLPVWKTAIAPRGATLLADVNPTFNWAWLARRVPVRVSLDHMPADETLVTGPYSDYGDPVADANWPDRAFGFANP